MTRQGQGLDQQIKPAGKGDPCTGGSGCSGGAEKDKEKSDE